MLLLGLHVLHKHTHHQHHRRATAPFTVASQKSKMPGTLQLASVLWPCKDKLAILLPSEAHVQPTSRHDKHSEMRHAAVTWAA